MYGHRCLRVDDALLSVKIHLAATDHGKVPGRLIAAPVDRASAYLLQGPGSYSLPATKLFYSAD